MKSNPPLNFSSETLKDSSDTLVFTRYKDKTKKGEEEAYKLRESKKKV